MVYFLSLFQIERLQSNEKIYFLKEKNYKDLIQVMDNIKDEKFLLFKNKFLFKYIDLTSDTEEIQDNIP